MCALEMEEWIFVEDVWCTMVLPPTIQNELRIAAMTDRPGYITIRCPQHHFEDCSMALDSHQAGRQRYRVAPVDAACPLRFKSSAAR